MVAPGRETNVSMTRPANQPTTDHQCDKALADSLPFAFGESFKKNAIIENSVSISPPPHLRSAADHVIEIIANVNFTVYS